MLERVEPFGETAMDRFPTRPAADLGQDRAHFGEQLARRLAAVAAELAADQIVCLDAVGALVDRRDPRVAQILRRAGLLDVAHPAMHLDAGRGDLDAEIGAPRLDDRDQQIGPALCPVARLVVAGPAARVDRGGGEIAQRPHRLGAGAHRQQHAADIRVMHDRRRRTAAARHPGRHALDAGAGIVAGLLIGAFGDRDALHADQQPLAVHHREHAFEAAIFLADAPADRALVPRRMT